VGEDGDQEPGEGDTGAAFRGEFICCPTARPFPAVSGFGKCFAPMLFGGNRRADRNRSVSQFIDADGHDLFDVENGCAKSNSACTTCWLLN